MEGLAERYDELLEQERERWWSPENFETWKRLYQSEHARGLYVLDLLRDVVPAFRIEGARVLDVGCGDAGTLIALGQHGARPFGTEISERSLLRGAVRASEHDTRVELVRGDGEALPYRSDSFDVVILDNVLEHVWHPAVALREARRVMRRGALLYVVTPKPFALYSLWNDPHYDLAGLVLLPRRAQRWYFERVRGGWGYDVTRIPTRRRVLAMLRDAGFALVASPRDLWIRYLRDRISRPSEVRAGIRRALAGAVSSRPWLLERAPMRWFWDVAVGSNHFLARRPT
jgi:ubiquinone/menaquinone biosynthesis C-methylase UbiE